MTAPACPDPHSLPVLPSYPDPLRGFDGRRICSRAEWIHQRAPELRNLFQHYMFGAFPADRPPVRASVRLEKERALGGLARMREIQLDLGPGKPGPLNLLLLVPRDRRDPAACFLGMNFYGNYQVLRDPEIPLPTGWVYSQPPEIPDNRARETARGRQTDTWNIERILQRGYAFATFFSGDVVPDDPALAEEALAAFRPDPSQPRGASDTGTVAAWAWGCCRALDYLVTVPELDPQRVAIVGHSRNGKTALLAAAMDERFALAIPSQAGCGGTGPCRLRPDDLAAGTDGRPRCETLTAINTTFPHWFCRNFHAFNAQPERLPFDQNALIALCAPRPVLLSNASEDLWANPRGQYAMLQGAAPVYALLGIAADLPPEPPPTDVLLDTPLGWFIRPGRHEMTRAEWMAWLDYADRRLR